jgi:hypothetical protein
VVKWRTLAVTAVVALFGGACARRLLTFFPHRTHLASIPCGQPGQPACLACPDCHRAAAEGHWDKPVQGSCVSCHGDASPAIFARSTRPENATLPDGKRILFSHSLHLAMPEVKGQCVSCHAGAVGVEGGEPLFPPMATCLTCHHHEEQFKANTCDSCHRQNELKTLVPLSFFPHDTAWLKRHGSLARLAPARCETCHAQTSCDSCHDSTRPLGPWARNPLALEQGFVHRFDFLSRHPIEARSTPGQCLTCHVRTECDACHQSRGVSAGLEGGASPHPFGWASGLGAATNLHGRAARRDLVSCASCHDQGAASNCVQCHKVGAMGGTPHPVGWQSSEPLSAPQCSVCHAGGAP